MSDKSGFDLDELGKTWRADAGPEWQAVSADVRAALMRARITFAIEMVIAAGGVVVGGLLLLSGAIVPGVATLSFAGFAGAAAVLTRGRAWRVSLDAVTNEMTKLEIEALSLWRTVWAGLFVCAAALIFVAVLVAGNSAGVTDMSRMIIAGALVFIAVSVLLSARALVVAMKRIENIRQLKTAYSETPSDS